MKTFLFSGNLVALLTCFAYLLGYKTETRREIRELHDSRLKHIYYYTVKK